MQLINDPFLCSECGGRLTHRATSGICHMCQREILNEKNGYKNLRLRAEHRGLEFTLTENEFKAVKRGICFFHGIPDDPCRDIFYHYNRKKRMLPHTSIDRLDNRKGYTADNVMSMCEHHNSTKHSITPAMVERLYHLYKERGIL
jgi:hypothetical protein